VGLGGKVAAVLVAVLALWAVHVVTALVVGRAAVEAGHGRATAKAVRAVGILSAGAWNAAVVAVFRSARTKLVLAAFDVGETAVERHARVAFGAFATRASRVRAAVGIRAAGVVDAYRRKRRRGRCAKDRGARERGRTGGLGVARVTPGVDAASFDTVLAVCIGFAAAHRRGIARRKGPIRARQRGHHARRVAMSVRRRRASGPWRLDRRSAASGHDAEEKKAREGATKGERTRGHAASVSEGERGSGKRFLVAIRTLADEFTRESRSEVALGAGGTNRVKTR
jgi:hypothetical protein